MPSPLDSQVRLLVEHRTFAGGKFLSVTWEDVKKYFFPHAKQQTWKEKIRNCGFETAEG